MSRPRALSGFPEWLPADRAVEHLITVALSQTFELHGFASLRTRSVEPVGVLLGNGETDKEIYGLNRLREDPDVDGGDSGDRAEPGLGLHFDLTVPLARFVTENAGHLHFPYRRYQIQQVWRGERPQEGRFREFVQADIDVIGDGSLAFHHEVEVAVVAAQALASLPIPPIRMRVNNRKLAEGFYLGVGLVDVSSVLRAVDKLAKIGPDRVAAELTARAGATSEQAEMCLAFADVRSDPGADPARLLAEIESLGVRHERLDEGLTELAAVLTGLEKAVPGVAIADMSVARGLGYYTGTVYETEVAGLERFRSVCSGGRYDSLATIGGRRFPGVGISIGVTRLVSLLLSGRLVQASREVPTCVLVAVPDETDRGRCDAVAGALRARGIPTEVAPSAAKFGKQIRHADRRGIPYVWFLDPAGGHEVKDIRSGEQISANPDTWNPPPQDRHPTVGAAKPTSSQATEETL